MLPMPIRVTSSVSFSSRSSPANCSWIFFAKADLLTVLGLTDTSFFFSARVASFSRFSDRSAGTSAVLNEPFFVTYANISPMQCLHGNCRLGQEQRWVG